MNTSPKVIEDWLQACEEYIDVDGSRCTNWEKEFIGSVRDTFDRVGSISPGQEECLENIYTKIP